MKNNMKPVDVGAPRLIPQGNLSLVPGTFASIRKELDDKNYVSTTRSSALIWVQAPRNPRITVRRWQWKN